jgi:glycosyltransferase involved in cell wall biosynthesis
MTFESVRSMPTLALDVSALWNQKTSGLQRVIRELTPILARAAFARGWQVVLVRHDAGQAVSLTTWSPGADAHHMARDLNLVAAGALWPASRIEHLAAFAERAFHLPAERTLPTLNKIEKRLWSLVPRRRREKLRVRRHPAASPVDAWMGFSAGVFPTVPPPGAPPERTVLVLHDLIPIHYSALYPPEMVQTFAENVTRLAFGPLAGRAQFVTGSPQIADQVQALFQALARQEVHADIIQWGYDRHTFFPDPDPGFRRALGVPDDALLIAAVSNQDPRKRFSEIQRAAERLGAYAVFLGQGQQRRQGRAIYLGYVSDDEVRRAYSSSDVVVNWSEAEGFGLPTIEALACRARVVVPPDNPTTLYVGGPYVHVAQRADVASLCQAILDASRAERPQPDLSRFDWSRAASQLEALLWPTPAVARRAA